MRDIHVACSACGVPNGLYHVGWHDNVSRTIINYVLNFSNGFDSPLYHYDFVENDYGYIITRELHDGFVRSVSDSYEVCAEVWRVD